MREFLGRLIGWAILALPIAGISIVALYLFARFAAWLLTSGSRPI